MPGPLLPAVQQCPRGAWDVGLRDRFTCKLADALKMADSLSGLKSVDRHKFDLTVQFVPENQFALEKLTAQKAFWLLIGGEGGSLHFYLYGSYLDLNTLIVPPTLFATVNIMFKFLCLNIRLVCI